MRVHLRSFFQETVLSGMRLLLTLIYNFVYVLLRNMTNISAGMDTTIYLYLYSNDLPKVCECI
jgi:hypothetical protein